jgi:WD40 repeat protein
VRSLAFAPDGTIASGDENGEIRLWDGGTGAFRKVLARQGTAVGSLSVSPDGKRLLSGVGTGSHHCHVYDLASGQEVVTYSGHDNIVLAPDGRWAATGGGDNSEIHLWDLASGERRPGPDGQPLALGGQGRTIWAAGFSTDGTRIGWGDQGMTAVNQRTPLQHELALP